MVAALRQRDHSGLIGAAPLFTFAKSPSNPGYNTRARAEAAIARWKQVIGDGLRARTEERREAEVDVGVYALNRMLELARPNYVRIA